MVFWSHEWIVVLKMQFVWFIFPLPNIEVLYCVTRCLPLDVDWPICHQLSFLDGSVWERLVLRQLKLFCGDGSEMSLEASRIWDDDSGVRGPGGPTISYWRERHNSPLKWWELPMQQHNVTSLRTEIVSYTITRTSELSQFEITLVSLTSIRLQGQKCKYYEAVVHLSVSTGSACYFHSNVYCVNKTISITLLTVVDTVVCCCVSQTDCELPAVCLHWD